MIGVANIISDVKQKILKKSTLKHHSNSWFPAQYHSAPLTVFSGTLANAVKVSFTFPRLTMRLTKESRVWLPCLLISIFGY